MKTQKIKLPVNVLIIGIGLLLCLLKLFNVLDWSWWAVAFPIYSYVLWVIIGIVVVVMRHK